jgi:hypothetical protein
VGGVIAADAENTVHRETQMGSFDGDIHRGMGGKYQVSLVVIQCLVLFNLFLS